MQIAVRIIVEKNFNFFLAYGSQMMLKLLHTEKRYAAKQWIAVKLGLARQKIKPII
jgi:hypothetical protein